MGAWAEGPIDNDTAADWMAVTMRKSQLPKFIQKGLNSRDEDEVRAAAFLLEQVGYTYMYDIEVLDRHLVLAIEKLHGIVHDKSWTDNWRDPNAIKRSMRRQIKVLKKRLRDSDAPESQGLLDALEEKLSRK